jgi:3-oxoacyl-[acyl-carrier-protein] synthase II
MSLRRVVVTGVGAVTPLGNEVSSMWGALLAGRSGIGRIQAFDAQAFESQIAGEVKGFEPLRYLSAKEVKRTERFTQFAIAAAKQAVTDAGVSVGSDDPFRYGVIIGSGIGSMHLVEQQHSVLLEKGPKKITPFMIPMLICNMAPGHVAIDLGFKGPNFCTTTACASGAHGLGEAFRIIQRNEADVMLAGGTESCVTPTTVGGFCALMALSRRNNAPEQASRPFDKGRDGFVIGEGAGVMVLEELEHAKRRGAKIYAEMAGYGRTADAYHMTAPDPDGAGAARAMALALADATLRPEQVTYINAHGTSTELNDKIETLAIKQIFGERASRIPISGTKAMHGHSLGASGAIEAAISALALQQGFLPPTMNLEEPDPECDLDYVPNHGRHQTIQTLLSNSFGFGGINACLVLGRL